MAPPTALKWSRFLIELGDGATPTEAFAAPCGLRSKGLQMTFGTNEVAFIDCDTPDIGAWMQRDIINASATISGEGTLDLDYWDTWRAWALARTRKNVRIKMDAPAADNGGYFQGPFLITDIDLTGAQEQEGGHVSFTVTLTSAGEITWTNAAA